MRKNRLKEIWAGGGAAVNAWLAIPNSFSAEQMAHGDFDSVTVDMQHGMVDFQAAVPMLQAISTTDKVPLVRVPWNDPIPIMKSLDAGAYGVVCPMVNNRADAEKFVGACRYAPQGYRSFGPPRGQLYGGPDYADHANDEIVTLAMIETAEAMDNLDQIMSVEGLDAVYIGPSDLAISFGLKPAADPSEPKVLEAIAEILAAAKRNNVVASLHCAGGAMAKRYFDQGFQLATLANDVRLMFAKAQEETALARGA